MIRAAAAVLTLLSSVTPASTVETGGLSVDEAAMRLTLEEDGSALRLPILNRGPARKAHVRVEVRSPKDEVRATVTSAIALRPGRNEVTLALPPRLAAPAGVEQDDLALDRLAYDVDAGAGARAAGLRSVSEAAVGRFALRASASGFLPDGGVATVLVEAHERATGAPAAGIAVKVAGEDGPDVSGTTDAVGRAVLEIPIVARWPPGPRALSVAARRGALLSTVPVHSYVGRPAAVRLMLDQPLYRPGQTLRGRALLFEARRRVRPGPALRVRIADPSNEDVWESPLALSPNGVARFEWSIPDRVETGTYGLVVETADGGETLSHESVDVLRYQLPSVRVDVLPVAAVVLPGEAAVVEVRARRLTGEPLADAPVSVVANGDELDEGSAGSVRTGRDGVARVALDLAPAFVRLRNHPWAGPFEDVEATVTVIDPTTLRSASRRTYVRASLEPLHVRFRPRHYRMSRRAPLEGYVSVQNADGTPARATVRLTGAVEATVHTDANGLARVAVAAQGAPLLRLALQATDDRGRTGHAVEQVQTDDAPTILIDAPRALLCPGEPARVTVRAYPPTGVLVQFWSEGALLHQQRVRAGNAPTPLEAARPADFRGTVTVTALGDDADESVAAQLLYPDGRKLAAAVTVTPPRARPGDEVEATLTLTDERGAPRGGVVALAGVDGAVLERARSEAEISASWVTRNEWLEAPDIGLYETLAALDPSRPFSDADQLLAEANWLRYVQGLDVARSDEPQVLRFTPWLHGLTAPLRRALAESKWPAGFPRNVAEVRRAAARDGVAVERLVDAWGNAVALSLAPDRQMIDLTSRSAGPDERWSTDDDLEQEERSWPWFRASGLALQRALRAYITRTDRLPRRVSDLAEDARDQGVALDTLRDPWGRRPILSIGHQGRFAELRADSRGADPEAEPFRAWTSRAAMFVRVASDARDRLQRFADENERLPRDVPELRALGIRPEAMRDPWGHLCRAVFRQESRYADVRQADGNPRPVTQTTDVVELVGAGPDGILQTGDDVELASVRRVVGHTDSQARETRLLHVEPVVSASQGAIVGWVEDETGRALPGVTVTAAAVGHDAVTRTESDGSYVLGSLPPGFYRLTFELSGFDPEELGVEVRAGARVSLDARLAVSEAGETITVSAEAPELDTTRVLATTASTVERESRTAVDRPAATPRLRRYFPDALVWQPEVETDASGTARVRFTLADNLTTWELAAVGSTADGLVTSARGAVVGALPFAAELDPPASLTAGDTLDLPIPLRNDTADALTARLSIERDPAFAPGPASLEGVGVPAQDVALPTVPLAAQRPARAAALTVAADAGTHADRIRREVSIRPDGEGMTASQGERIGNGRSRLSFLVPAGAIAGTAWAELRLLPNLGAHVADAVRGATARPWGCAEQTISAAFPGLLLLEMESSGGLDAALTAQARASVDEAVERLRGYETGAGLAYWSADGTSDPALTAYGLRFLARAARVTTVDAPRIAALRKALLRLQRETGAWTPAHRAEEGTLVLVTAQVARALAETGDPREQDVASALARARAFVAPHLERMNEPYLFATQALLARALADDAARRAALARLRTMERRERDGSFWDLQTNTPFYGWGAAGRLETTGLVLQALAEGDDAADPERAARALAFLLRRKDRHGVWWSSQATVNVLEGLVATLPREPAADTPGAPVEIWNDGVRLARVDWPASGTVAPPIVVPLGDALAAGEHRVELRGLPGGLGWAQVAMGHARPWTDPVEGGSKALRFSVGHDAATTARGAWITTRVHAERVGHRGYGMLLAEVGLPPGADVDRASLEAALSSTSGLTRYELQPDRVVLYLWPQAGGADLDFRWRPRFAMDAQAAPSELYDYYNPEEHVHLRPARFAVR